jgi:hypothetical protein
MDLYEKIAKVAYDIYVKSGYIEGRDLNNWLEAERIVVTHIAKEKKSEKKTGAKKKKAK